MRRVVAEVSSAAPVLAGHSAFGAAVFVVVGVAVCRSSVEASAVNDVGDHFEVTLGPFAA